jgi:hypothetical protein
VTAWREAEHLPNRRPGRAAGPRRLPRQRRGTAPQGQGRYPDFDVLDPSIVDTWDEPTRRVVLGRLHPPDQLRFFRPHEVRTANAFCDVVVDQDAEPRVPVLAMLDRKYAEGKLDGFRFADLPDDRETWHLVLEGLDQVARRRYGSPGFADLDRDAQRAICQQMKEGVLRGGPWDRLNVKRAWSVVMRGVLSEFYSHPWAWNEIGFGGPAYPRGFIRFGQLSTREPFEPPSELAPDPVRDAAQRGLEEPPVPSPPVED